MVGRIILGSSWIIDGSDAVLTASNRMQETSASLASMDAGNGISVNVRCEQFTYFNHFGGRHRMVQP